MTVKSVNTRPLIIESTVWVEEVVSKTLGELIGIDWKKSKSFGYGSSSLSFHQKIQIIQDLNGINKETKKKFTYLLNIRNKFVHVREVYTFSDFFSNSGNGSEIKRNFKK
ncbi:MAG: hypothetical protein ABJR05_11355 [Balneola sp.]